MKNKLLNDVILVAAVLLIAAIALFAYLALRSPGQTVVVTVNGEEYATFSLDESIDESIVTQYGTNRLIIKDGTVHHRAISYEGEAIVCKPNRFVVSIE